jgi:hypothetical protein
MQLEELKAKEREASRKYASEYFGISLDDVVMYHGGICYSTVVVRTLEAVKKIQEKVKGDTVNGGWFDGMQLGGCTTQMEPEGVYTYRVMC